MSKQSAQNFLQLAVAGKVKEAYDKYIHRDFKHHNAWYKGDAVSLMKGMAESAVNDPDKQFTIYHVVEENDTVMTHSHLKQNPQDRGMAVVHIFRFSDDKIIELWDVIMPVPEVVVNENGLF